MEELLLTEREAASMLKLCPKTLYHLRNRGELIFLRVGRAIRYERLALLEWIERKKTLTE